VPFNIDVQTAASKDQTSVMYQNNGSKFLKYYFNDSIHDSIQPTIVDLLDRIEGRVDGARHEYYDPDEDKTEHFDSQNYKWTSCDEFKFYLDYGTTPV